MLTGSEYQAVFPKLNSFSASPELGAFINETFNYINFKVHFNSKILQLSEHRMIKFLFHKIGFIFGVSTQHLLITRCPNTHCGKNPEYFEEKI